MIVYLARDIPAFVMYCVNGESGSSLLIESTDSMIFHSVVVGVEYYNYLFDSGHQESSQSFTMNCMFRPL